MSTSSSAIALPCDEAKSTESTEAVASSEIAVSVRNLGKSYRLWNTPQDRLKQPLRSMFAQWLPMIPHKQYFNEFWALRDINFEIKKGEALGIIGRNGSGKSTLLQILCGTLAPTCGSYETRGRVSALLELGSGFNPEFSGRDNVYMNASILGLTKEEIDERYESIVEFADIGQFIYQPVKTYSNGMYVRLAFAVVISVDPDILVVDEALSVGDIFFQQKCFRKIDELVERGCTLIFVSHDIQVVQKLCHKAILLKQGRIECMGIPEEVVSKYRASFIPLIPEEKVIDNRHESTLGAIKSLEIDTIVTHNILNGKLRHGPRELELLAARVTNDQGQDTMSVETLNTLTFHLVLRANKDMSYPNFGFSIFDRLGNEVFSAGTTQLKRHMTDMWSGEVTIKVFKIKFTVSPGRYTFNLAAGQHFDTTTDVGRFQDVHNNLGPITVTCTKKECRPFYGIAQLPMDIIY